MKYTFGTSSEAASRLEEIAKFFNPLASYLISQYMVSPPEIALDVGCGPGFTTDMLSHATKSRQTYGLDRSPEFLAIAKDRFPHCRFLQHDITDIPFPVAADIMYVRFVLSHLPDPVRIVNNWITQLKGGGILVIEEVEAVETEVELFRLYLSTNEALVASQGANLFVGRELGEGNYRAEMLLNDHALLPVPDSQAATWFLTNTRTIWKEDEFVLKQLNTTEIKKISNALMNIAESHEQQSHITWRMRRLVFRRL